MLLYLMTAAAGSAFLMRLIDGSALSYIVYGCALIWFLGAGVVLAVYRNPDRPSRLTFAVVENLMLAAIVVLMLAIGIDHLMWR
jgi:hypothetical protein